MEFHDLGSCNERIAKESIYCSPAVNFSANEELSPLHIYEETVKRCRNITCFSEGKIHKRSERGENMFASASLSVSGVQFHFPDFQCVFRGKFSSFFVTIPISRCTKWMKEVKSKMIPFSFLGNFQQLIFYYIYIFFFIFKIKIT